MCDFDLQGDKIRRCLGPTFLANAQIDNTRLCSSKRTNRAVHVRLGTRSESLALHCVGRSLTHQGVLFSFPGQSSPRALLLLLPASGEPSRNAIPPHGPRTEINDQRNQSRAAGDPRFVAPSCCRPLRMRSIVSPVPLLGFILVLLVARSSAL